MEREKKKEEETIEVRTDKEVDKETTKEEEGGEEEEVVMIIGAEVTDKIEMMIRIKGNIKMKNKILIKKFFGILVKCRSYKFGVNYDLLNV